MKTVNAQIEACFKQAIEFTQEDLIYLSTDRYAKLWGMARSRVDEKIAMGEISERNGALKKGCASKGKHKRINRFFNPYAGTVCYPMLGKSADQGSILDFLRAYRCLLEVEQLYLSIKDYAKCKGVKECRVKKLIDDGYLAHKNGGVALGTGIPNSKSQHRLYVFFNPSLCEVEI